jgi:hypothetical protein
MVAGGEHVGAHVKQFFGNLRGHAEAACGIFGIDDREFNVVRLAHVADVFAHNPAPRAAENITHKKNLQKTTPGFNSWRFAYGLAQQARCHPERNKPRVLRLAESKDLRLLFTAAE